MELLKLLVVFLGVLVLRGRLAVRVVRILAYEAALVGHVHRVSLVHVGEGVFWNADLLALVLLAAATHEVERRHFFFRVPWMRRVC